MENIFKSAKAIVEVMERIPLEERTIATEIAGKILQFNEQKKMMTEQDQWAKQMQAGQSGIGIAGAAGAVADLRRNN